MTNCQKISSRQQAEVKLLHLPVPQPAVGTPSVQKGQWQNQQMSFGAQKTAHSRGQDIKAQKL